MSIRNHKAGSVVAAVITCAMAAVFLMGTGGEGLTLASDYTLPLHLAQDSEVLIDTEYCEDPYLTGEGWIAGWLHTDSSGDIELRVGIPPWNPDLSQFTFCGDDLVPFDEGIYSVALDDYEVFGGGNKLRLIFDLPQIPDDLVVVLKKGGPRFEVTWDGVTWYGKAMPVRGTSFDWTVE